MRALCILTDMTEDSLQHSEDLSKKWVSDDFEAFHDALETLYIKHNISGRLKFAVQWPAAAAYIFSETLMKFDREGTEDRLHREELEHEADERRLKLLDIAAEYKDKSVEDGMLQMAYVEPLVRHLGRGLALRYYSETIVSRFLSAPPGDLAAGAADGAPQRSDQQGSTPPPDAELPEED